MAHGSLWVKHENPTGLSEGDWNLFSFFETLPNITNCLLCLYYSLIYSGLKEKCVDSLVFETLIPKPMMQHYISLLLKHRRLVLSGPSGTGKSYLASRLAEYLVDRSIREVTNGIAVTFNMHRQSCKVIEKGCPWWIITFVHLAGDCYSLQIVFLVLRIFNFIYLTWLIR